MRKTKKMISEFVEFNRSTESQAITKLRDIASRTNGIDYFTEGESFYYIRGDVPVLIETHIGNHEYFRYGGDTRFSKQIPVDIFQYIGDDGNEYMTSSFNFSPDRKNSLFILYEIINELKRVPCILITYKNSCDSNNSIGIKNFLSLISPKNKYWKYSIELNDSGWNKVHFNINEDKNFVKFLTQKRFGIRRSYDTVRMNHYDIPKAFMSTGWFEDRDKQKFTSYDSVFDTIKSLVNILKTEKDKVNIYG